MNETAEERTVSPVAAQSGPFRSVKARKIAVAAGGAAAAGLVLLGINSGLHEKGSEDKAVDTGSSVIAQVTQTPAAPPAPPPEVHQPPQKPQVVYVHDATPTAQAPALAAPAPRYVLMPVDSGEGAFEVPAPQKAAPDPVGNKSATAASAAQNTTQVAWKAEALTGSKAGPAIRLTYVMMPQLVPCALETAMDSTVAGFIQCHTTHDVLSPDHVTLMPAGTRVTGIYKNDVRQGQNRLFSFVGSAITPEGIPVPLNAQVADGMGRSGIPGDVDNHFWSRFGAGILLAGSQSALQLAQALVSKGGNSYFSLNSGSATDVATEILRQQEQQQPTVTVQPGTLVSLVIDHPIDFSDALKVMIR